MIDDNSSIDILSEQLIMDDPASYQPPKSGSGWPLAQSYFSAISILSAASLLIATAIWLLSLRGLEPLDMTDIGLLSILPYTYYVALGILTISLAVNIVHKADENTYLILAHFFLYIGMLHATPTLLYGTLRYGWAWKHVGVVDFIQRNKAVDFLIHNLNAYHNWPGFFSFNALLTELSGYDSALSYALWGSVVANLLNLGAMLLFTRALTSDRRLMWLATWFLFIINWVGQDYFAPQSMAFFMHLVILGVALTWFSVRSEVPHAMFKTWVKSDKLARWINPVFNPHEEERTRASVSQPERASLLLVVMVLMASIVSVHQLTPFMTILTLGLFVVFRRINARMLPILLGVFTVTWVVFITDAFFFDNLSSLIKSLGALTDNLDSNLAHHSRTSPGQVLVSAIGRGLTVGVVLLAGLGGLRRLWNGRLEITPTMLVLAPFLMMVGNSYGGEMIFRVYLFSTPAFAFLVGALIFPTKESGTKSPWMTTAVISVLSGLILFGFLFAYYGKDNQFYFTEYEREGTTYLFERAPHNTLLVEGSRLYPTQYLNYEKFTFVAVSREPADNLKTIIANPVERLGSWLDNSAYEATYIIFTRSQRSAPDAPDKLLPEELVEMQEALRNSPNFKVVFENRDVVIMSLATQEDLE